jgi:hypothetical protein
MPITGLRNTTSMAGRRENEWRNMILRLYPFGSQRAPLAALTAVMKSEVTSDPIYHWFTKRPPERRWKLFAALAAGTTAGNTQNMTVDATTSAFGLKAGDILMVESTSELLYVNATPTAADTVSVIRGFELTAGSAVPLADPAVAGTNPMVKKIGSAYEEGSAAPDPIGYDPVEANNQTQIFRETFGLTNTAIATTTRTGDEVRESKQDAFESFTESMEMAFWFGKKRTTTRNNQPLRLTDGLFNLMPAGNKISLSTRDGALTFQYWESLIETIFRWGSSEKVAFCGLSALLAVNQMVRRNAQVTWQLGAPTKEYGMDIQRLTTPAGVLVLKHHPLFSLMTGGTTAGTPYVGMTNAMAILDMAGLRYRYLKGRDVKYETNIQLPGVDGLLAGYLAECGMETDWPDCNFLITGVTKGLADVDDPANP